MKTDDVAQHVHDKATRGESLSAEEQAHLEQWYARLDREESAILINTPPPQQLAALQAQVNAVAAQLVTTTQDIQKLTAENEAVQREIGDLQLLLAQKRAKQSA